MYLGSLEKGAGSRRLTEGFFCEIVHLGEFHHGFVIQFLDIPEEMTVVDGIDDECKGIGIMRSRGGIAPMLVVLLDLAS